MRLLLTALGLGLAACSPHTVLPTSSTVDARVAPVQEQVPTTLNVRIRRRGTAGAAVEAAPGIEVVVEVLESDGATGWSTKAKTDGVGRAIVRIPRELVERDDRYLTNVRARIVEDGLQKWSRVVRTSSGGELSSLKASLPAVRGATAFGRVVDGRGRPVEGEVSDHRWSSRKGVRRLVEGPVGSRVQRLDVGRFAVHFAEAGVGVLLADAGDHGTGTLDPAAFSLEHPADDLVITVDGPAAIVGRLVDPHGAPHAGVELTAELACLEGRTRGGRFIEAGERTARGGGHVERVVTTDEEGRFRFGGLVEEEYTISIALPAGDAARTRVLARELAAVEPATLTLRHARPFLAIRMLEPDGSLHAGFPGTAYGDSYSPARMWGDRLEVHVVDGGPIGERPRARGEILRISRWNSLRAKPLPDRGPWDLIYDLPEGRQYIVVGIGDGFDCRPMVVEIPAGVGRVEVALRRTSAAVEMGELRVQPVFDGPATDQRRFDVTIEDAATGIPLLLQGWRAGGAPCVFALPQGDYHVVVSESDVSGRDRRDQIESVWGRAVDTASVRAGAVTDVVSELAEGARLDVEVIGALRRADTYFDVVEVLGLVGWSAESHAIVEIVDVLGRRQRVRRSAERLGLRPRSTRRTLTSAWPHREAHVSEVLPTGSFTVVGRLPGGRTVEVPVELVRGETAGVVLDFGD